MTVWASMYDVFQTVHAEWNQAATKWEEQKDEETSKPCECSVFIVSRCDDLSVAKRADNSKGTFPVRLYDSDRLC